MRIAIVLLTAALWCAFIWNVYPKEIGYSEAHRAELQNKINNLTPLSIADIGLEAE